MRNIKILSIKIVPRPRRNHSNEVRARVALATIKGEKTLAELSSEFDLHQNKVVDWKINLLMKLNAKLI